MPAMSRGTAVTLVAAFASSVHGTAPTDFSLPGNASLAGNFTNFGVAAPSECTARDLEPPFTNKLSRQFCKTCADQPGCKWCPLSQTCEKKCRMKDSDNPEVDDSVECDHSDLPTWLKGVESTWGESLRRENADVLRCIQGRYQGWKVSPDYTMKKATLQEMSKFGCFSALMRSAFKFSLAGSESHMSLAELGEAEAGYEEANASTSGELETSRRLGGNLQWNTAKQQPTLCKILSRIQPGVTCEVEIYGKTDFATLRSRAASPLRQGPSDLTERIFKSMNDGPIQELKPGAGKSGSGFGSTADSEFKIKFGLRNNMWMKETDNLLALIKGQPDKTGAVPMSEYLQRHSRSLLNRYYGLVRVRIDDKDTFCLLMHDASYGADGEAGRLKNAVVRYDLKGRSRSQTKKQDPGKTFTLLNGDFKVREHNELQLTNAQCHSFREAIADDANWLGAHGMIDYSLFVLIAGQDASGYPLGCQSRPGTPFCTVAHSRTFTVSVIDYLNNFNTIKKLEIGKFTNYNGKIIDFANSVCRVDKKEYLSFMQRMIIVVMFLAAMAICVHSFLNYGPDILSDAKVAQIAQQRHLERRTPAGSAMQPRYGVEMMQPQQMQLQQMQPFGAMDSQMRPASQDLRQMYPASPQMSHPSAPMYYAGGGYGNGGYRRT